MKRAFFFIFLLMAAGCTFSSSSDYKKTVSANLDVYATDARDGSPYYQKEQVEYKLYLMEPDSAVPVKTFTNEKYPNKEGHVSFSTPLQVKENQYIKLCILITNFEESCEQITWDEIRDTKETDSGVVIIRKEINVRLY